MTSSVGVPPLSITHTDSLENINVYNIICDSLGIKPLPNNGTLRLPFEPKGLHSDEDAPVADTPADPVETGIPNPTTTAGPEPTSPASEAPPAQPNQPETNPESDDEKGTTWWGALWGKFQQFKNWAGGVFDSVKDNF